MAYDNRFLARLVLPLAPSSRTDPIYVQACTAAVRARCFLYNPGRQLIWGRCWGSLHMYVRIWQFDIDASGRLAVSAGDARGEERRTATIYSHNICGLPCGLAASSSST